MQQQKLKIKLPACAYDQINRQYNYNTTEIKTACKIQRKKLFVERGKINNMFSWVHRKYSEAWEVILGMKERNENTKETLCTS